MSDITTEAGKRLLGVTYQLPVVQRGRDWKGLIAAIEAEAWEKGKADTIAARWRASVTAAHEKGVADALARVRERVEGLLDNEWRECGGACHDVTLAAVLAILEEA